MSDISATRQRPKGVPEGAVPFMVHNPPVGVKLRKVEAAPRIEQSVNPTQPVTRADTLNSASSEAGEDEQYSCTCLLSLKPCWDGIVSCLSDCWKSVCDWIASFSSQVDPEDGEDDEADGAGDIDKSKPGAPGQAGSLGALVKANPPKPKAARVEQQLHASPETYSYVTNFNLYWCQGKKGILEPGLTGDFLTDFHKLPEDLQQRIRRETVSYGTLRRNPPQSDPNSKAYKDEVDAQLTSKSSQLEFALTQWALNHQPPKDK